MEELSRLASDATDSGSSPDRERSIKMLSNAYKQRLEALQREEDREAEDDAPNTRAFATLAGQLRRTERQELIRLQAEGQVSDNTLRKLERELDLLDLRFPAS